MAISKKATKKIIIKDTTFLYKVSKIKQQSEWRAQKDELDTNFMNFAKYYGLGEVKDITINVVIQLAEKPVSSIIVKFNSILVNGFLGPEQITQIKPKLIAALIKSALADGWNPSEKGDYNFHLLETKSKDKRPIILQLPRRKDNDTDDSTKKQAIEFKIEDD